MAGIISWTQKATYEFLQGWAQKRPFRLTKAAARLDGAALWILKPDVLVSLFRRTSFDVSDAEADAQAEANAQELFDYLHSSVVCPCKFGLILDVPIHT